MKSTASQCAKCAVFRCHTGDKDIKFPALCPTKNYPDLVKKSIEQNKTDNAIRKMHLAWVALMNKVRQNRFSWTRVEEIVEIGKILKLKKMGIASCYALLKETRLLSNILEAHGFEVVSVCCLAGEITPQDVDIVRDGVFCNPVLQADILNQEKTELNILVGLCLGHDILFIRHSRADVTPFIVKDRALGHNPAVALYLSETLYKDRFFKKQ